MKDGVDVLAEAAAKDGKTYYPHPPLKETAMVQGLAMLVEARDERIEELEAAVNGAIADLKDHELKRFERVVEARRKLMEARDA